jgi:hypothetical protein
MISDVALENLRTLVGAYCKATGKPLSAVSKEMYGNSSFLSNLFAPNDKFKDKPASITIHKLDEIVEKFRKKWPENKPFPALRPLFMHRSERR